jgi:hypothetical protein
MKKKVYFSYLRRPPPPPPLCRLARPARWGFEYSVTGHIMHEYMRFILGKQKHTTA